MPVMLWQGRVARALVLVRLNSLKFSPGWFLQGVVQGPN
jgi:hypothetical protein